jgi:ADP-heptose:LPS heptosyltransferase
MHIATAVGTPVLGLYGPTDPRLQGPYGEKHLYARLDELHCIGCNLLVCPTKQECFRNLSAERVLALAQLLIEKNGLNIEKRVENS